MPGIPGHDWAVKILLKQVIPDLGVHRSHFL